MHQQLWGYKVEEKLYLGVCEQKRLNTTALFHSFPGNEKKYETDSQNILYEGLDSHLGSPEYLK
jgi:hypothetical protein